MIGQSFGNYRAISVLGEGGMGVVYLAEHPEIGRKVAIKVLHADFARDQQVLGRFLNEARAANAIRHPNIIEILDSGALPDHTPFLVMELLEGESLAARIRRVGPMPLSDVCDFAYQTASALSAAHAKGIVHRDLKPDNLFIVPDPHDETRERVKVLDFGIAKLQQHSPGDSVKTRTGTLMGTPIYMSPEQCRGVRTVDHRTDIYSMGVILYEMVAGHPPFVSEGFGDLVNMHMNMVPPPPGPLRADLPPRLEALILTMLAKAPDQRFESMTALQIALKGAGEGLFTVHGSSPDLASGAGRTRHVGSAPRPLPSKQTTLTASTGENIPHARAKGRLVLVALAVAALAGIGLFAVRARSGKGGDEIGNKGGDKIGESQDNHLPTDKARPPSTGNSKAAPQTAVIVTPPAPASTSSPPAPVAPNEITIVVETTPPGASVVGADDGRLLGSTPLTLTRRAHGADLKIRLEKEGFVSVSRSVSLGRDETLAITLERKPRPVYHPRRPANDEPARL